MVDDAAARDAVRRLMNLCESANDQFLSLAYVLAKRDRHEYERILKAAEIAQRIVIQPWRNFGTEHNQVYTALDNPDADWSKAVLGMLKQCPIEITGEKAIERLELMKSLEERFDQEIKKLNGSGGQGKESKD